MICVILKIKKALRRANLHEIYKPVKSNPQCYIPLTIIIRNMLKRLLLSSCCVFMLLVSQAQFDTSFAKKRVSRCADSLIDGFKTRNWEQFARYSNPAMIGTMGGKQAFITYIAQTFSSIPDSAWKLYKPGTVLQIVKTATELQAVIELHSVIEWEGRRISATSFLIGQSWDGGMFWTFFDSQSDRNAARTIKPDLSPDIIIPEKVEKIETIPPPSKNKAANNKRQ